MKRSMALVWVIMFIVMFATAFFTYPLLLKWEKNDGGWKEEVPELTRENYKEYHILFEEWFNDIIPYKDYLIKSKSRIDLYGFKESPSDDVIIGREGWLFYEPTMKDYKRINLYSLEELEEIRLILEANQKYFEERGIEYIIFIAPNKASIYGDMYLPEYICRKEGLSRTEQAVEYLKQNTSIKIIFPQEEMIAMAEDYPENPLYLHSDTHWNYLGGYCGAKALLHEMGIELPEIDDVDLEKNSNPMFFWNSFDLARMIGMSDEFPEDINFTVSYDSKHTVIWTGDTANSVQDFYGFCRTTSDVDNENKLMFVRDSFGTAMMPFLATQFKEMYSPHKAGEINWDMMEPDVVIYETVEREAFDEYMDFHLQ